MRNFYEIDWQMLEESRLNDFFTNDSEEIIEVENISENNDSEEVIIEENIENDSEGETEVVIEKNNKKRASRK